MSLGENISAQATKALVDHGQVAILRKPNATFDKEQGKWVEKKPTDYPVHFVPEEFSEMVKAQGNIAGDLKVHIPASEIDFVPYVGSNDRKHLELHFGEWVTTAAATMKTATSSGIITEVGKTARYKTTQILWTFTVRTSGN